MRKRKPLTDEQKLAQKVRQEKWRLENKERIAEKRRIRQREKYAQLKAQGGEEYQKMLDHKAAGARERKLKMTEDELLELQEKERLRWLAIKNNPEAYSKSKQGKIDYIERIRLENPEQYEKVKEHKRNWWKNNKAHGLALVRARQARLANASPSWADNDEIKRIYRISARITELTGIQHHVDHIIPLKGKLVCGLHVHQNLRVIAYDCNCSKSNNYEI